MSKIILVAETGSDITPELAERYGIEMVPMHVSFDTAVLLSRIYSTEISALMQRYSLQNYL